MDSLSDVLRSVRLKGAVFFDAQFSAPWCVMASLSPEDCKPFLAVPTQLVAYHVILRGRLVVGIEGQPPIEAQAGEIILFPYNDGHTLASGPGLAAVSARSLVQPSPEGGFAQIRHGGGGETTQLVCGFLGSEGGYNPLLACLPRVLTLNLRQSASREWIEASVKYAAEELSRGQLTSSSVISRLSETLLVDAIRQYVSGFTDDEAGWLKGLSDPYIGRALAVIHQNVGTPWTAEALAAKVGLSRSAFVDRFKGMIGMPPIRYLTVWRMQMARLQLRETNASVQQVAHAVGYQSEEAFSRSFKREFGQSPTHWRGQPLDVSDRHAAALD